MSGEPRKHHIVPSSYLRYWASGTGPKAKLLVLDKERGGIVREQAASKVARIGDFYRLDTASGFLAEGADPLLLEKALGQIEGEAATAWKHLSNGGELDNATIGQIAMFMATWAYRTPWSLDFYRETLGRYTPQNVKDQEATEWLRGPGTAVVIDILGSVIRENAERFMQQPWGLARPIDGQFVAADMPYLALGETDEFKAHGLTPGFAVPIGPALLVLCGDWFIQKFSVENLAQAWNRVAVDRADRWVFARPGTVIEVPMILRQQGSSESQQAHIPLVLQRPVRNS